HLEMKILNAHAQPVESQATQCLQVFARCHPRIDFDAHLSIRRKCEELARRAKQVFDLRRHQLRWCSAAPMKLHYLPIPRNAAAYALQLPLQNLEIRWRNILVLLNDDVASAKQAQALAEGNVHVDRNWRARPIRFHVYLF